MEWFSMSNLPPCNHKSMDIIWLHDYSMTLMTLMLILVFSMGVLLWYTHYSWTYLTDWVLVEMIWTLLPVGILMLVAVPSISFLYMYESQLTDSLFSVKVTGHQWYWSYELSEWNINFDSFMLPDHDLMPGMLRLLEVDNSLILPINSNIQMVVTSADVLHAWTVNPCGIKVDACPGRLNITYFNSNLTGKYYGQCSELCGVQHSFMPICVEVVPESAFFSWVMNYSL